MVCNDCQKLADDVELWKTKYKEAKGLKIEGKRLFGVFTEEKSG